jgi:hypothetical protein
VADGYDVFISYHTNRPVGAWVREFFADELRDWLNQQFPDRAATVFLDETSIPTGDEFPERLITALGTSKVFVPVLSPSYFSQSPWCLWEWQCYRAWRPRGVMPILYYNKDVLPADVQAIQMEDFSGLNSTFKGWRDSPKFGRFQQRVRTFAEQIAARIRELGPSPDGFPPGFALPKPPRGGGGSVPPIEQRRMAA